MKAIGKFIVFVVLVIAIVAIAGRLFFFDIGRTANYSMVPNLIPGDIFLFRTVGLLGKGDVVVCQNPDDPSTLVVGRIMGVPGDTLELKNNHFQYGSRIVQHQHAGPLIYRDMSTEEQLQYVVKVAEEKVGGVLYSIALMDTPRGKDFQQVTVPDHHFFLIGDNRNMAYDSRNFGLVPIDTCKGEAMFLLWASETNGDMKQSQRSFNWIH